jgi:polyhydroxybutyrate depolymerase
VPVNRIARLSAVVGALVCLGTVGAPQASAAAGVDALGQLSFGGLQRTYVLHVPSGLDHPSGLVINLHGAGMNGGDQAAVTGYNGIADAHGWAVVYPDGIDLSWADGRGASGPDQTGVDDVGFLAALVDQLTQEYGIPRGRVFATGMSAGAFMANRLACQRADLVAAIAPVAGTLGSGFGCAPSRPVSVMAVHGTEDPVVPFNGGPMVGRGGPSDIVSAPAMAQRWRDIDGCPGPVEKVSGAVHRFTSSGCGGGTEVVFVQIDGGGHTWPAGNFSLPVEAVGVTTHEFNASQASGQFFAAHGR